MHVASPEVCDNEDGYQEGAEGDGVAHGVHHVQPPEEVLLGGVHGSEHYESEENPSVSRPLMMCPDPIEIPHTERFSPHLLGR